MSEQVEIYRAMKDSAKAARAAIGVNCPECVRLLPRAHPAILLPNHQCRIHRYRDPRPETVLDDWHREHYNTEDSDNG